MIMKERCPICGSKNLDYGMYEDEPVSNTETIREWHPCCENGHEFIISEVLTVTSRLVAKDDEELDRLIKEEEKEAKQ